MLQSLVVKCVNCDIGSQRPHFLTAVIGTKAEKNGNSENTHLSGHSSRGLGVCHGMRTQKEESHCKGGAEGTEEPVSTVKRANRDLGEILKICKVILVYKLQCKVVCID